ncbi:MAG: cytochrome c-type biogenesis CcmF C-terminal domain-containing protein [bacterium]|nr:cytochrome c-type biogenesis CcmF C-terminal domain-containing protein [bacterium]
MLAEIGVVSLFLAFLAALYAIVTATIGGRRHRETLVRSARNAAMATFPLMIVSCGALLIALITQDYQINYVRSVSDPQTPLFYRITALWGSQQGSLLFWSLLMSGFAFGAMTLNWKSERRLMPTAIAYMMAVLAFFLFLSLFLENPFERVWVRDLPQGEIGVVDSILVPPDVRTPPDDVLARNAQGLNPLLRHFGMIIHPPMLYLGFVGFTIPFAFAMAALASGDLSTNWIKATRRWTLIAWLFLSLGLILGGRWAYDVLGWGGYWGWDPVENAAFLPWLLGTAFLHSVMIQEKRGMLKVWNMFLIIGTFSSVMFATFATRSGLVESVHSFARSGIGTPMFLFWSGITLFSVGLILWRWNRGELRDEHHNTGIFSRETMFVLNNVIFVTLAAAIFWGSFGAPILSELFAGQEITLGTEYFMQVTPPLFLVMYILMGVAPVTAWGATSAMRLGRALFVPLVLTATALVIMILLGTRQPVAIVGYGVVLLAGFVALYEIYRGASARVRTRGENPLTATLALFTRNRRRYGGYIVHLGITIIGIGVIGSTLFQFERQITLAPGETAVVNKRYLFRYDRLESALAQDGRLMDIAYVGVISNGEQVAQLRPRIDQFPDMPMTIAGAHSTVENDFYVLLLGFDEATQVASFRIYINPLVNLVWWGGLILILGTFISAWPNETAPARVAAGKTASAGATA